MSRSRSGLTAGGLLSVAAVAGLRLLAAGGAPASQESLMSVEAPQRKAQVYAAETEEARTLFQRLGKPAPHEWLAHFDEPGELVREYAAGEYNRKTPQRSTIYLQPLGALSAGQEKCLVQMAAYVQAFFDCRTVCRPPVPVPREAYNPHRRQTDAGRLLDFLSARLPDDALVCAGVTGVDLYREPLNFVFGLGAVNARVGVYSLYRYGADYPVLLRRALKVAGHEIGHVFSLRHCIFYRCLMNGSNSLAESDARPMHLCPVCLEKLRLACGFDPVKRFEKLAAFYQAIGFEAEAQFVKKRLAFHVRAGRDDSGPP